LHWKEVFAIATEGALPLMSGQARGSRAVGLACAGLREGLTERAEQNDCCHCCQQTKRMALIHLFFHFLSPQLALP
jgi:hypothetical protein